MKKRIKDIEFFREIITEKSIYINSNRVDLNIDNREEINTTFSKRLKELIELEETFSKLGINLAGNFSIYENDIEKMLILRDIILKRRNYSHITGEDFHVFNIKKYSILLVQGLGKYRNEIFDIFNYAELKEKYKVIISLDDCFEESANHSIYTGFKVEELFSFSNLDIDTIEQSLLDADYSYDFCFDLTNRFLLEILNYYDKNSPNTDSRVLDMVQNVYGYLEKISGQNILYFINKMQAIKRKREFTIKEIEEILSKKDSHHENDKLKCAFLILLEYKTEFEVVFSKLIKEDKKSITDFPIYNLIYRD